MPRLLTVIILLTFSDAVFGQADTIKYNQFGDKLEFSELNLNPNSTFEFHYYNIRSCRTWYSVNGTWKKVIEKIIFTDTMRWEEENLRIDTSSNNTDFVLIRVKNDKGNPLKGIEIIYNLPWANNPYKYLTDKNGEIRINKEILSKQRRKDLNDNDVQFAIRYSNQKYSEISMSTAFESKYDKIELTVVDRPEKEIIIRTTIYRIDCSEIYFESQQYTGNKGYRQKNWGNFREHNSRRTTGNKVLPQVKLDIQ